MRWRWLVAALVAAAVAWAAMAVLGWWWMTFLLGLALGVAAGRRAIALGAGAVIGVVAWGVPLAALAVTGAPVGRTALVLSAILGVAGAGVPAVALTVLTGVLLAVSGAWLGSAARLAIAAWMGRAATAEPAAAAPRRVAGA